MCSWPKENDRLSGSLSACSSASARIFAAHIDCWASDVGVKLNKFR